MLEGCYIRFYALEKKIGKRVVISTLGYSSNPQIVTGSNNGAQMPNYLVLLAPMEDIKDRQLEWLGQKASTHHQRDKNNLHSVIQILGSLSK